MHLTSAFLWSRHSPAIRCHPAPTSNETPPRLLPHPRSRNAENRTTASLQASSPLRNHWIAMDGADHFRAIRHPAAPTSSSAGLPAGCSADVPVRARMHQPIRRHPGPQHRLRAPVLQAIHRRPIHSATRLPRASAPARHLPNRKMQRARPSLLNPRRPRPTPRPRQHAVTAG